MKCPVCKTEFEFTVPDLEEAYYDCSHCNSSLLLKNGKCEVLSEGQSEKSSLQNDQTEENTEKNIFQQKEVSPQDPVDEKNIEESVELTSRFFEESSSQSSLAKNNEDSFVSREKDETFQPEPEDTKSNEEFLETATEGKLDENLNEEKQNSQKNDSLIAENIEEEEFFPDETTQVPELSRPDEEISENFSEQKEERKEEDFQEKATVSSVSSENKLRGSEFSVSEKNFPSEEGPEKSPASESQKEDFSEVAEFGNTQDQDKQGPFLYDLILSEINSQDIREKILFVLEDEYLNLSFRKDDPSMEDDINIKDGQITIEKISPVQAYVIVTSLMGLPLNISWKQHHIAESS